MNGDSQISRKLFSHAQCHETHHKLCDTADMYNAIIIMGSKARADYGRSAAISSESRVVATAEWRGLAVASFAGTKYIVIKPFGGMQIFWSCA